MPQTDLYSSLARCVFSQVVSLRVRSKLSAGLGVFPRSQVSVDVQCGLPLARSPVL